MLPKKAILSWASWAEDVKKNDSDVEIWFLRCNSLQLLEVIWLIDDVCFRRTKIGEKILTWFHWWIPGASSLLATSDWCCSEGDFNRLSDKQSANHFCISALARFHELKKVVQCPWFVLLILRWTIVRCSQEYVKEISCLTARVELFPKMLWVKIALLQLKVIL